MMMYDEFDDAVMGNTNLPPDKYEDYAFSIHFYSPIAPITSLIVEILEDNDMPYRLLYGGSIFLCGKMQNVILRTDDGITVNRYLDPGVAMAPIDVFSRHDITLFGKTPREIIDSKIMAAIAYFDNYKDIEGGDIFVKSWEI